MAKDVGFPTVLPGGHLVPYMSAARRHAIIDYAFEQLGGQDRLVHEANRNPEAFWKFMSLFKAGLPRISNVEQNNAGNTIEEVIDRLDEIDRKQNAKVIDVVPVKIDP